MTDKTGVNLVTYQLTEKEVKQIELQREIKHGQLVVYLKNGEPIRVENIKQSIML